MKYNFSTHYKNCNNIIGLRKKRTLIYLGYLQDFNNFKLITKIEINPITKNIHERHLTILIHNS